jgi:hypothetical protein
MLNYTIGMKHEIIIKTGKIKKLKERTYIFKTNEEIPLEYFKTRKSLDLYTFPKYVNGTVEDYYDEGGETVEWKDFVDFIEFTIQNIISIHINGVDINQDIIDTASTHGATTKFPMLYHAQFEFETIPEWVFNWYPNTGTLSKQKATEKQYSMKSLGNYPTIKEALNACK